MEVKTLSDVSKFNPYHDSRGRFASAGSATSFTYAPGKSDAHDKAIQRGNGYTENKGMMFVVNYEGEMKSARRIAQRDLDNRGFRELIMDGKITQQQANQEFGKVMSKEMEDWSKTHASKYGIDFSVEHRDVNTSYNVGVSTAKSADVESDGFVLDQETNDLDDAAFNEWLNGDGMKKSAEDGKSVLFVGLKITGADSLAIEDGEKTEDFHVTLVYGNFDRGELDDESIDRLVDQSVTEIKDSIPDTIHFDAIGRFSRSESSDGKDVIYAQVAPGQLEETRKALLNALKNRGIEPKDTFPTYNPHMTLAYIDPDREYELSKIDASGTAESVMIGHGRESSNENNFSVMKTDDDKRLVFGWASVSIKVDGVQLEDRQKDIIDPEDLEEAAYEYVLNFRDTGEEHIKTMRKKGKLVESCVFTAEKQKAMGIPEGILPVGWWIGFKIEDDAAWEKVKSGVYKMFSIEGRANRVPVEKADKPTGCGVLVVRNGKVLIATRKERSSHGEICGPGGHIEEGETPEEAAVREAQEEFGITCRNLEPLGVLDGGGKYGTSAIFLCSEFEGTPRADEDEMTGARWVALKDLSEDKMFLPFKHSLSLLPEEVTAEPRTIGKADPDRYDHIIEEFP